MKITVYAIGKIKEKYFSDAIAEYLKRCSRFAEVKIVELAEAPMNKSEGEQKMIESAELLEKAKGYKVALDGRGRLISSEELAEIIRSKGVEGEKEICFLIGGSRGHSDELRAAADDIISFGKITYPHQLFRLVLAEQIYRALTINAGLPYHK